MSKQEQIMYELTNQVASLTIEYERLKAENAKLRSMLPFTREYQVVVHDLSKPIYLHGEKVDRVCYSYPIY